MTLTFSSIFAFLNAYCSPFPVFLKPPVGGEPGARSLLEIDRYGFFYSRCLEVRVSRWPICAADLFGRFLGPISLRFPLRLHAKMSH